MSNYRPGGFDDSSDDDAYFFKDDYYDDDEEDDLPGEPCISSLNTKNKDDLSFGASSSQTKTVQNNEWSSMGSKKTSKAPRPRENIVKQHIKFNGQRKQKIESGKKNNSVKFKELQTNGGDFTFALDDFKIAAMQNKVDVINGCIKAGIEVDAMFASGWTALMYAVNCANPDAVQTLLEHGADPNFHKDMYSVLLSACASTRESEPSILKCVELLIEKGADINSFDRYHMSPVIYAAKEGRSSVVKKLMECKADINKQDTRGYTALIWAVQTGRVRVVHTLLELGANVNKQTSDGSTAMDFAVINGRTQIQEMLKKYTDSNKQKLILTEEDVAELEKKQKEEANPTSCTITYGDLELFLSGLELGKLIPLFHDHHVKFADLLRMTDADLIKLGVAQFGNRKKLLDAIRQTHKKEWSNTSLPAVTYNKQISCAEAIAMVQNIKKHVSYVGSTIGYVGDQIKADKQILVTAHEGVGAEQLIVHADEAIINTRLLYQELTTLRTHLAQVKGQEGYRPPDIIVPKNTDSGSGKMATKKRYITKTKLVLVGFTVVAVFIWKKETVIEHCNTCINALKLALYEA